MPSEDREAALNNMGVLPGADQLYIVSSSSNTSDTMEVFETTVRIDTDTNDQAFTLTLPNVSLAKGKIYSIYLVDDGANVTIQDNDDDSGLSNITLDADDEYTVLYSDGFKWYEIASNHA
jgi:hypothetical protein